jgi:hypothetical protein
MVMLTLADAMLDTFGGSTIDDTRDTLERYVARISAPVVRASPVSVDAVEPAEAGSGGDD